MKILIIITCLLVFIGNSYSQQMHPSQPLTQADYLNKRKIQRTTGYVMIGGGILLIAIGGAVASQHIFTPQDSDVILPIVGLGTALCSIPFFISAGDNKRKAASINLGNQPNTIPQQHHLSINNSPAITIKIGL